MSSSMLYTAEGMNTVDSVCEKNPVSIYYLITVTLYINVIWVEYIYVKSCLTFGKRKSFVYDRFFGKLDEINWMWS